MKRRKHFQIIYSEVKIALIQAKKEIRRKLQTNIPYKYKHKNLQHDTGVPNPATYKRDCTL